VDNQQADKIKKHDALIDESRKKERTESPKNNNSAAVIETNEPVPPPSHNPDMFYGLVGDVGRIAEAGTEVNPVSAALSFISFLGANIGRDTHLLINNTYHHPRVFTLHIGRSSRGGKGDSQQLTHRIRRKIEEKEPDLLGATHTGGLSSGEGLAALIHDGYGETPPIHDKRLWVVEGELANVLNKIRREGSVLSVTLRELWDGSDIKPAVKNRPMGVTDPHVGLHACITPTELTKTLGKGEIDNGFANRFLMIWAENVGCVPFPKPTADRVVEKLADLAIDVIKFSLGNYPDSKNGKEMNLSASAKDFYSQIYQQLKIPLDNELIAGLLARRAPYILRLAMLFALTDKTRVIEAYHLKVALAWVEYATSTVQFVFYNAKQTERATEISKNANKILEFIQDKKSGCSRTEISTKCFNGHLESEKISKSLNYLLSENPPLIEQVSRKINNLGRKITVYQKKSSANYANCANYRQPRGLEGYFDVRINANSCELTSMNNEAITLNSQQFAGEKEAKKGCNPRGSQFFANSHNSQPIFLGEDEENEEKAKDKTQLTDSII